MIRFDLLTIFPEMIEPLMVSQIFKRGSDKGLFEVNVHDLRDFTEDRHRVVDDTPFGGGPGMVLKPEPIVKALEQLVPTPSTETHRIYLTPRGHRWNQTRAAELLQKKRIVMLCGRYRGVDQRVIDGWIDEEISIGDYVVSGGEVPALVVLESIIRLIPGVLGNRASLEGETFTADYPEAPVFTRPRVFRGRSVPEPLLSGNHEKIAAWQREQAKRLKPR